MDAGQTIPVSNGQFYAKDFSGRSGSYNIGVETPVFNFGWSKGGSIDPNLSGAQKLNWDYFGKNESGYRTEQVGFSHGTGWAASAMYSAGQTWTW